MFEAIIYEVISIDGDYANLVNVENRDEEPKLVARALLPENISEGCQVKYELLQYSML